LEDLRGDFCFGADDEGFVVADAFEELFGGEAGLLVYIERLLKEC
jgi:hypothetical protein